VFITESLITWLVVIVGIVAIGMLTYLTVQILSSEDQRQRASVEPENDTNTELT